MNAVQMNAVQMNAVQMNAVQMNAVQMNGIQLNGIQVTGVLADGSPVIDIQVIGTALTGIRGEDGAPVAGEDFVGADLTGLLANGQEVLFHIGAIALGSDPHDPESPSDLHRYLLERPQKDGWTSACGTYANGDPVPAYPLSGRWDYGRGTPTGGSFIDDASMFTFACKGSVLAHCLEIGYRPWETLEECTSDGACQPLSLRPFHQACTRMMRADYCGDGTPHTVADTPINVWDTLEIQQPSPVDWPLEAEWGSEGATCVKHTRWVSGTPGKPSSSTGYILDHCPEVVSAEALGACGTDQSTFETDVGIEAPVDERAFFRSSSCVPASPSDWPACLAEAAESD